MIRIYVDFNIMQQSETDERVDISTKNQPEIERELSVDNQTILFDSGMEVQATLQWDEQHQIWYGIPNWLTLRDIQSNNTD